MEINIVKTSRIKETHLESNIDHNKGKTDFLITTAKNVVSWQLLFNRVENKKNFMEIKHEVETFYKSQPYFKMQLKKGH